MGFLFPGRVSRLFSKCIKQSYVLHVRYADGSQDHLSRVLRFNKQELVIEGFSPQPREERLYVFINELNTGFSTRILEVAQEASGKSHYYCTRPTRLINKDHREERYLVYPKGNAVVLPQPNSGDVLQLSVWDVTPTGIELINQTNQQYHQGYRFCMSRLEIDHMEALVKLEVTHHGEKSLGEKVLPIIGCKFTETPIAMERIMDACRRVDGL